MHLETDLARDPNLQQQQAEALHTSTAVLSLLSAKPLWSGNEAPHYEAARHEPDTFQ